MRLWIQLLPDKDFLANIKFKQGITLCYFNLLDLNFRSFDPEIAISTED